MKFKLFTSVFAVAIAIGATAAYAEPSHKEKPKFFCGTQHGVPTTFAHTNHRVNVPIIRWVTSYFSDSGWTPEIRCQQVSRRFQTLHENGTLKYITTGTINGYPVVCVTKFIGDSCSTTGLLFTLRLREDPNSVIQQLFINRIRASYSIRPVLLSGRNGIYYNDGNIYIDFEEFISIRTVDEPTIEAAPYESYRLW